MTWANVSKNMAVGLLVGVFALGCGSSTPDDPEFGFGETEMQNAVVGNWNGALTLSGQAQTLFTLSIARAPSLEPACGSRTFSGPLCVETSNMNLEATLTTVDQTFNATKFTGSFMVIGLELQNGELSLTDAAGVNIVGQIDPDLTTQDLTVSGSKSGTIVMKR